MQYCSKCHVYVRGHKQCCPLCQSPLYGSPENPAFPSLPTHSITRYSAWKIALFLTICFEVSMAGLLFLTQASWILWAMLFGVIALGDTLMLLYYHNSLIKLVTLQFYVVMALTILIDSRAGWRMWSISWVIPMMFIALIPVTVIIEKGSHLALEDYIIYLFLDVVFSLLQIIPILTCQNPFPIAAVISICFMVIFAAFIIIFHGKELKNAGGKYLNL